ncbi:hypothetical protein JOF56_001404 [Kibdelosporangium banguiense]|uniref:Beta-lactamase class A catalytic domain-containing protein n=1 Tax=Kibdelosporangium banguiense TaxID=1365924 RepID=A0ABS4T9B9_9PSEU|nr:serine hydrolase [Kibdelosporangium banguiense]MBP2321019.1 hypothetical protein [Kibdelosporangium banguiense]
MSQLANRALLSGFLLAAVVLVAPTPAMSVTPADPAVAEVAPPPITPAPDTTAPQAAPTPDLALTAPEPQPARPDYAAAMLEAAKGAVPNGITFGMAVLDLQTGQLATTGSEQFYSASLSKLMLVVDMLDRDVPLTSTDHRLITQALSASDDDAMNSLWIKFDGYNAMTRVATSLGMADTRTTADRSQWGEVVVSPADFARLYQHIMNEMTDDDEAVIETALSAATPEAADGFDQYFGLLGGALKAFAKQGWMYYGNRLYLHSAGVVMNGADSYAVVLMSTQPPSSGPARANLTSIAASMQQAMTSTEAQTQGMK